MAVSLGFAKENETIISFEILGGIPGIELPNTRASLEVSKIGETVSDFFTKDLKDYDVNKTLFENTKSDFEDLFGFGSKSGMFGFSVYHIFNGKKYCDCENCSKKHKQKKYVFGGNGDLAFSKQSRNINADLFLGRSFINSDMFKLFLLGVVGFDILKSDNSSNDSKGPEIGMELDFVLSPVDHPFRLIFGCRGLVGMDFCENGNKYLNASIKPKIGIGWAI